LEESIVKLNVVILLSAILTVFSSQIFSAPYSITYTGTIAGSTLSGVNDGQPYTLELVFDNSGSSANSQTWTGANLTCAIWTMNTGGTVRFAQDFTLTPPSPPNGTVTTNGSGVLTTNFTSVTASPAGSFTTYGPVSLLPQIYWYANSGGPVFFTNTFGSEFNDASGGLQMAIQYWTNPAPFTRTCSAAPPPTVTSISPTSGSTAGGDTITITGTNLTGATSITVGGNACTTFNVSSATSATCTTPAGTAGTASVVVTTSDGPSAANTLFTYIGVAAVPTLSEWGQLMLALMVIGIAWHFHNNRQNSF
jgi:hypothetical protein